MRKIIPLRDARKRRLKHPRTATAQTLTTCQTEEEEGMVTILLKDGTSKRSQAATWKWTSSTVMVFPT